MQLGAEFFQRDVGTAFGQPTMESMQGNLVDGSSARSRNWHNGQMVFVDQAARFVFANAKVLKAGF